MPDYFLSSDNMYMVANKSFKTMQGNIARMKLSAFPPGIEIDMPKNNKPRELKNPSLLYSR